MPLAEPQFPWTVPVAMLAMFGASTAVLLVLIRRWTTQGRMVALWDWCASNSFHVRRVDRAELPEVVRSLTQPPPRLVMLLDRTDASIVQIETFVTGKGPGAHPSLRWNLLLHKLKTAWPMTGLRPHASSHSVLDFFPLSDLHAMAPSERFALYGAELVAARRLGNSVFRGLLPPDIGLMLVGSWLLLDFSARPFDPLTLQRMTGLARQLVARMPSPSSSG